MGFSSGFKGLTDVSMCQLQVIIYIQLVLEAYMTIGQKIRLQYVFVLCFHF